MMLLENPLSKFPGNASKLDIALVYDKTPQLLEGSGGAFGPLMRTKVISNIQHIDIWD